MKRPARLLLLNVPVGCTETELQRWIEDRGYAVKTVLLIRDTVSGTSPSFAYAELIDIHQLAEARRNLDGNTLQGRGIQVVLVVPVQAIVERTRSMALPRASSF